MSQERRDAVLDKVASIISEMSGVDKAQLTPEKELRALGIDSLDGLEILGEVEDAFHINVTNKDARSLVTVNDMVEGIIRLQDAASEKAEVETIIEAFSPEKLATPVTREAPSQAPT